MSTGIATDICQTSLELDTRLRTTRLNSESERLAERMTAVGAANWAPERLGLGERGMAALGRKADLPLWRPQARKSGRTLNDDFRLRRQISCRCLLAPISTPAEHLP